MDDLNNRDRAQGNPCEISREIPGDRLPAGERDALKDCLDGFVAQINARFVEGADDDKDSPVRPH